MLGGGGGGGGGAESGRGGKVSPQLIAPSSPPSSISPVPLLNSPVKTPNPQTHILNKVKDGERREQSVKARRRKRESCQREGETENRGKRRRQGARQSVLRDDWMNTQQKSFASGSRHWQYQARPHPTQSSGSRYPAPPRRSRRQRRTFPRLRRGRCGSRLCPQRAQSA